MSNNIIMFDLTTLNLPKGSYELQLEANSSEYPTSNKSNTLIYNVEEIYTVSGQWTLNSAISDFMYNGFQQNVNFISYEKPFSKISYIKGDGIYYNNTNIIINAIGEFIYPKDKYKVIEFTSTQRVSKYFYEWLTENAKKDSSGNHGGGTQD